MELVSISSSTTKPTVSPTIKPTVSPTIKPTISPTTNPKINSTAKPKKEIIIDYKDDIQCSDEEFCRFIEIKNLDPFKSYKIKLRYETELDVSEYSDEFSFETGCNYDVIKNICRNKCGNTKTTICGPSEDDPNVKEINKDKSVEEWPFFKKAVSNDQFVVVKFYLKKIKEFYVYKFQINPNSIINITMEVV